MKPQVNGTPAPQAQPADLRRIDGALEMQILGRQIGELSVQKAHLAAELSRLQMMFGQAQSRVKELEARIAELEGTRAETAGDNDAPASTVVQ